MPTKIFDTSVFKKYFASNDPIALAWADNVLQKLIAKDAVPDYIVRDNDFEDYFSPITIFFGYLVRLARVFRDFKDNSFLADQYLTQMGHFTCGDEALDELAYIISNSLRLRAQRGTIKMFTPASGSIPSGELLRLICAHSQDFFKLGVGRPQHNSWNLNNCSPLYRGNTGRLDLNVGYEYTESVKDLLKYPLINNNYVFLTTYQSKECMEIEGVPAATYSGIGANESDKRIIVTPELNFEITFYVAQDTTLENITFGCLAFDAAGVQVPLQNIVTGGDSNFFFETRRLNKPGQFYMVRGILYNKDQGLLSATNGKLNIGFGHNLRMNVNVASIIPYIVVDNVSGDDVDAEVDNFPGGAESEPGYDSSPSVYLWNVKATPCSFDYSRSYLNNKNFIDIILANKNGKYTNTQIDDILRRIFIPYNSAFKTTYYSSNILDVVSYLLLEDGDKLLLEDGGKIPLEF